ncbi:PAS domain S-box protein [Halorientalis pallida]|uniref:histidine kinase n=1 Tax=Halorientalis pallida TaxID=2479928 RepID=A0A498L1Q3_9EURY|nr:PAS domain S-box protein [Halorientalis pallida]RXK51221.1 PAS domain S-box protein [Halorientalis pallida]
MTASSGDSLSVVGVGTDERLLNRSTSRITGPDAVTVEAVATGDEALSRVSEADCLVTTYALPDTDGVTLIEAVREAHPNVPVVLVTDQPDDRVASEAIGVGVTDYVRRNGDDPAAALATAIEDGVDTYRSELALRESEQRYRTLVERSHDGIYIYHDDRFLFVNDRITEITGYEPEELYEMDIWDLVHPDDREWVKEVGSRRRRPDEEAPNTYEARVVRKDDETRHLEFSVQTTTYDGEAAVLGSVRDVTERRRQERELAETKEFMETILDTLEDVIFVFSLEGDLVRWNDQLCAVTGYTDEELDEMRAFDLLPEEYYDEAIRKVRDAVATGSAVIEAEVRTKDGRRLPFEFRGAPLSDEDGEIDAIAGVARDISERLAREEELVQYQTIVEAVGDAVYTLDEQGEITFVNDALLSVTGYQEEELLGEFVGKVMRQQDVETARDLIGELVESEERTRATFEMEAIDKDGHHIRCEDHVALLVSDGKFRGTAGVVRDITQRKAREQQLRRQNERLDRFASVVSHDLRNPLNVILGRVDLARDRPGEEHLDAIERSAMRMERMIDDLLTLARDGQTVGETEPIDLASAARDAWKNVETYEASLHLDDDLGTLPADRARLASLLENLFRNAIEHGGEAVKVSVGTMTDAEGATDGGHAESGFYVEDDGPGIPDTERDDVFKSGYSTSDEGTGLGLVIVKDIAEAHDWSLSVTDAAARGDERSRQGVSGQSVDSSTGHRRDDGASDGSSGEDSGSPGGARFEIGGIDWTDR